MSNLVQPFDIFAPYIPASRITRQRIADFVSALPGFVCFYSDANNAANGWITDPSLGMLAIFANDMYAGAAIFDIQTHIFKGMKEAIKVINKTATYNASDELIFNAAVIAFRHTPSATNYVRLEAAALRYQSTHAINAEGTQR